MTSRLGDQRPFLFGHSIQKVKDLFQESIVMYFMDFVNNPSKLIKNSSEIKLLAEAYLYF